MSDGPGGHAGQVRGVLFAHATMANGMVEAVRKITGVSDDALVPVSNDGLGTEEMARIVDDLAGEGPAIFFTDLQSGSCGIAARLSCKDRHRRAVVCGVNLPMLLDFVFHRDMPLHELVERVAEKGRSAIHTHVTPPP